MIGEILGLVGSVAGLAGGLFGGKKGNKAVDSANYYFDYMENEFHRRQMNLDANRRKRDIVRAAQVASANAEAAANSSGALRSSGLEGARGSILGQSGVNYLGVSQNQEIGNLLFNFEEQKGSVNFEANQKERTGPGVGDILGAVGGAISKNSDTLGRMFNLGGSFFSSI